MRFRMGGTPVPRRPRCDHAGAIHHVMNRGSGRRPIFESRQDVRYFLSLLVHCVRGGRIEVFAFSIMTTHYHLLVRSVDGDLAGCMQWVQGMYARYFNRTRGKPGPVFCGRYRAKLVSSWRYARILIWYIDMNAVKAGLVDSPELYPYGSCHLYVWAKGPRWLSRSLVESLVTGLTRTESYDPRTYVEAFSRRSTPGLYELIERVLANGDPAPLAALDDLVGAAPDHVQRWLAENAANADGGPSGVVVAAASTIQDLVKRRRSSKPDLVVGGPGGPQCLWDVLEAGLLTRICGLTQRLASEHCGVSLPTVRRRIAIHCRLAQKSPEYVELAGRLLEQSLERDIRPLLG